MKNDCVLNEIFHLQNLPHPFVFGRLRKSLKTKVLRIHKIKDLMKESEAKMGGHTSSRCAFDL
jgi:hypothetical protein